MSVEAVLGSDVPRSGPAVLPGLATLLLALVMVFLGLAILLFGISSRCVSATFLPMGVLFTLFGAALTIFDFVDRWAGLSCVLMGFSLFAMALASAGHGAMWVAAIFVALAAINMAFVSLRNGDTLIGLDFY